MSGWLLCPECGERCDRLWYFRWCVACWYVFCGGDLALDEELEREPSVTLQCGDG